MVLVFMVAEKPSLAASISSILSHNHNSTRKNGPCSIHEWSGNFPYIKSDSVKFRMTSVCGRVMSVDFPAKYNAWDRVDPIELFSCPIEKRETNPKMKIPSFLSKEARGADYLILWLDCDKEGENIGFDVIDCVAPSLKQPANPILRAKFSSITEKDIRAAMHNLVDPDEKMSKSVDARQELDLRIGCSFTRFQTNFFQGKYGDLDAFHISYGPCQTPTLGFCVDRHDQMQTFKPEPFWILEVSVETESGKEIRLDWDRVRLFDRDVASTFYHRVKSAIKTRVPVISVITKEKQKERPIALNTVELMRVASAKLGYSPHTAMTMAEKLYTQGYISYPRTETTQYHENFDLKDALKQLQNGNDWGDYVKQLLSMGYNRPRKGHDAGDHPPITPTRAASRNDFDSDHWRIYDYIVRHFIASISYNCKYSVTTTTVKIKDEKFTFSGKRLIDPGFTAVFSSSNEEEYCPTVTKGDLVTVKDVKLSDRFTKPPDYLTESDLITLMEKHGIGTDASIPVHINNIIQRGYVTVSSGRKLIPKPLGIVLVHGYRKIDKDLVHSFMRSAVETQLDLIAQGKADFRSVLSHTLRVFQHKFEYFVSNVDRMDQLFELSFTTLASSGKPLSRCGKCHRFMKLIQTRPTRLHCTCCDETLALPQNGNIRMYKELKCPLDDYELLYYTAGVKGKSTVFCPYCYNHPPFPEDMKKNSGCNSCPHPTCPHGLLTNGVSHCVECEAGILVLDQASGPKWKLGCTKCDVIVRLFNDATKVSVLEDVVCDRCESQLMKVEYKDKTKLAEGKTGTQGCIYCDSELNALVEKHRAIFLKQRQRRGTAIRGKAGSSGRKPPKDKMSLLASYFV